jgi:hypothetical protein
MKVSGQLHATAALPLRKQSACADSIGDWVGPRAGLDAMEKRETSYPYPELNPD